jgi:hypothetical protein
VRESRFFSLKSGRLTSRFMDALSYIMWPSSDDTSSTTVWLTNTSTTINATKMSVKIQGENLTVHISYYTSHADPSDRAV